MANNSQSSLQHVNLEDLQIQFSSLNQEQAAEIIANATKQLILAGADEVHWTGLKELLACTKD
tara:strand:- start:290 stop:478 length:189 start_codon:yes stop_codon:yes gene_type:complete